MRILKLYILIFFSIHSHVVFNKNIEINTNFYLTFSFTTYSFQVAVWNEVEGYPKLITAANFCQNGKFAVVGTYDGRCIFYITDRLKYHTQIHVRSSRGRNSVGRKITGVEPMPGEDKILITSNDSRIRLYDLRDLNVSCKYKGYVNVSSQIKASFSHDGKYNWKVRFPFCDLLCRLDRTYIRL